MGNHSWLGWDVYECQHRRWEMEFRPGGQLICGHRHPHKHTRVQNKSDCSLRRNVGASIKRWAMEFGRRFSSSVGTDRHRHTSRHTVDFHDRRLRHTSVSRGCTQSVRCTRDRTAATVSMACTSDCVRPLIWLKRPQLEQYTLKAQWHMREGMKVTRNLAFASV